MARLTYTHAQKKQHFARSSALPESDNAAMVFMVFQGIEMKEERKKGGENAQSQLQKSQC